MENLTTQTATAVRTKYNRHAVIGFVLTLVGIGLTGMSGDSPIAGLVILIGLAFGIIGLRKIKFSKERGRGLALISIVIGSISLLGIIASIILIVLHNSR